MIGRRSTREIALAAEQATAAHDIVDTGFHQRIERTLADSRQEQLRMHAENRDENKETKQLISALSLDTAAKISEVHKRIDGVVWRIGLIVGAATAIGYGLQHYLPAH